MVLEGDGVVFLSIFHIITIDLLWEQLPRDVFNNKLCKYFCVFLKKCFFCNKIQILAYKIYFLASVGKTKLPVAITYMSFVLKHKTISIPGLEEY